jgi:hypothetical protein
MDPDPSAAGIPWPHVVALADGRALALGSDNRCSPGGVVGGDGHTARIFDPGSGWSETDPLNKDRGAFVMLALPDGRVLVTGGANANEGPSFSSSWLWDPAGGTWAGAALLGHARTDGFGVRLDDRSVLVGGGTFYDGVHPPRALATVERYEPAADRWSDAASLPVALGFATGVRLGDGAVLVIGSRDPVSFDPGGEPLAFLYEPGTADWRPVAGPGPALGAELLALDDGGALLLSGTARRFDRASGAWREVAADRAFEQAQAILLPSGQVLVAGGQAPGGPDDDVWPALDRVELWDPESEAWTAGPPLSEGRQDGELVVLADGSALYVGGAVGRDPNSVPTCPAPAVTTLRYVASDG